MEIIYIFATLFRRVAEWHLPLTLVSMDVAAAFDNIDAVRLDDQLALDGLSPTYRLALLRETVGLTSTASQGPVQCASFPVDRGMCQGGLGTPLAWNWLLHRAVRLLQDSWQREGEVALSWLPTLGCPIWIYADNIYLLGSNGSSLRGRVAMVLEVVESLGVRFGRDFPEVLENSWVAPMALDWRVGGRLFVQKPSITVLGVAFDSTASTAHMVDHRARKAEAAWHRNGVILRDSTLPASRRWQLWDDTVGASLLWGSSVWTPRGTLQTRLAGLQAQWGRRLLRMHRAPTEDWVVFFRRRRTAVTRMQVASLRDTFFQQGCHTLHRWMGHAVRLRVAPMPRFVKWRDCRWWHHTQRLATMSPVSQQGRWRHPVRNWTRDSDAILALHYGPEWKSQAVSREEWKVGELRWLQWVSSTFGGPGPIQRGRKRGGPGLAAGGGRALRWRVA